MPRAKSAIPVGTQFSPDLIDLRGFVDAACRHSGDNATLADVIWKAPIRIGKVVKPPTRRRKNLPLESAVQYGLLAPRTYEATDLARNLSTMPGHAIFDAFAKHILLSRGGLRVVEAAQQMELERSESGVPVTGDTLAAYLSDQGFFVAIHNTAINSLRLWLSKAGIFGKDDWKVDVASKERLLGLADTDIAALVGLSAEQKAFAIALCRIDPPGHYPAARVRESAERILGRRMDRSSLPNLMRPLKTSGFIDFSSGGTAGGKTAEVWTTPKFRASVLGPFLELATSQLDAALTEYFKRDLTTILTDLESSDTSVKGLALEAYAIQVMRRMGLRFVRWRERAHDHTGQAEVDAILAGVVAGSPTRWQVQCKNTPSKTIPLESVAKEVGLLPLTKATHILILANCDFSDDAQTFARETMRHNPVSIFLMGKSEFDEIRATKGGALAAILQRKATEIASLPRAGLDWLGTSR